MKQSKASGKKAEPVKKAKSKGRILTAEGLRRRRLKEKEKAAK